MDCAPSVDVLQRAAVVAADWLLIPAQLNQFALKGILEMSATLVELKRRTRCQIAGIIPTLDDRTTRETQRHLRALVDSDFAPLLYPPIPLDVKVREANRIGQTLWEYAPESRVVVEGYKPALDRLLELK